MMIDELLRKFPVVSDQVDKRELRVILRELERVLVAGVPGDVVEMGCYQGTSALFLRRMLDAVDSDKTLHVYDSFQGLPPKSVQDNSPAGEQFKAGELTAGKAELIKHFKHAGLRVPVIHKSWFSDLTSSDMPPRIALAFLDGDFYASILDSLRLVWPRLSPGAVVIVDDYASEALPGAAKAVHDWRAQFGFKLKTEASLAIFSKVVPYT